jgi:type IV secretory pathway VirB2 component (pilin)
MIRFAMMMTAKCMKSDVFLCFMLSAIIFLGMGSIDAFATSNATAGKLGEAMCTIPEAIVNGNIGRAIATIGIIIIGIMATLGRITWTQAMIVGVGIAVIFGAAALAEMLGVDANDGVTDCGNE